MTVRPAMCSHHGGVTPRIVNTIGYEDLTPAQFAVYVAYRFRVHSAAPVLIS